MRFLTISMALLISSAHATPLVDAVDRQQISELSGARLESIEKRDDRDELIRCFQNVRPKKLGT
jgi:hypothetical protein